MVCLGLESGAAGCMRRQNHGAMAADLNIYLFRVDFSNYFDRTKV